MTDIYHNYSGTTKNRFKIGKNGNTIYALPVYPDDQVGVDGDWCLLNGTIPQLLKKVNGEWRDSTARQVHTITQSTTVDMMSAQDILLCEHQSPITLSIDTVPPSGYTLTIKDISGNVDQNPITLQGQNGVTFDDTSTVVIDGNYGSITLVSNGNEFYII